MKPASFHPDALQELSDAVDWYEHRVPGLGSRLYEAVGEAVGQAQSHPESGALRQQNVRQLPVRRFPYMVVYRVNQGDVAVIAVAHAKRRAGYWRHRR